MCYCLNNLSYRLQMTNSIKTDLLSSLCVHVKFIKKKLVHFLTAWLYTKWTQKFITFTCKHINDKVDGV